MIINKNSKKCVKKLGCIKDFFDIEEGNMEIVKNYDSVIIVLHEIYGINEHIKKVCKKFSRDGYDVICPNLINLSQPFNYASEKEAYEHFIDNIGFDLATRQAKEVIVEAKKQYKNIYLLGYSVGATVAWLCSEEETMCSGIIGYYGSRIRDYMNITPKCPTLLIFPSEEISFNVEELVNHLNKDSISAYMLNGKHGFGDPFSKNYCEQSFKEAQKLVDSFLQR